MKCRLLTAATMAVMMLLGPLAATAFADFDVDACRDALIAVGVDPDVVAELSDEEALTQCDIHGLDFDAEVISIVEEQEPEAAVIADAVAAQPTDVLGVSLARTGANTLILALFGAVLVGLGVLAVRRPKRVDDGA